MITEVSIHYFKAIEVCEGLPLQPFTAFVGNNGSGKSSVMEALQTLQRCVSWDVETAFKRWGGLEKVRNYRANQEHSTISDYGFVQQHRPICWHIEATVEGEQYEYQVSINLSRDTDRYVVENEELHCNGQVLFTRNAIQADGLAGMAVPFVGDKDSTEFPVMGGNLLISQADGNPFMRNSQILRFGAYVGSWQFLYLNAHEMGLPTLQDRLSRAIRLDEDGRNIAEYLLWIRKQGQEYLDSIVRKMEFVLPYIKQIQPHVIDTYNREVELRLIESHEKSEPLPGWLLSSGTLRILALLSMFDTPNPPSVLFVDEVENGLDPRTIGLLLNEMRNATMSEGMQVVVTTHSPYLLDMVPMESIIATDKRGDRCEFFRPATEESLTKWKEKFSPGKLYSMGKFRR